jgi:hypothetical protein
MQCCTRNERCGTARLNEGTWKLKGTGRCFKKGTWPLCLGDEDAEHKMKVHGDEE